MKLRKIYNLSIVCWLMAALLTSCFDDKGNYDYQNINEVTIEGIDRTKVYELFSYESTLTINPVVKSTVGDEKNYDYTWKIIPKNAESEEGDQEKYVVSKEKNLVYPVNLDDGDYIGFFEVKDLSNGVTWIEDFYLKVKSKGSEGWIIACKQDGKTRLDLITKESSGKNVLFPDLWNGLDFDMGEPKRLFYLAGMEAEFMFPLLVTDKSTYSIMGNDFHVGEDTDMKWYFGLSDGTIDMTASVIEQYSTTWLSNWWVINSKGEIYSTEASTAAFFSYPINKLNGKEEFEAAPFIGVSYTYNDTDEDYNYNYAMVFYDKTNRQFLSKYGANNYPDVMKCSGTQIFDVKTGRDMVFMDSHVVIDGLQVAVLKDPQTQDFYLYGFTLGFGKIEQNFYGKIGGPVSEAIAFALHPTYNTLFYATKNKVYRVSLSEPSTEVKEVLSFDGEDIVTLKFNKILSWGSSATSYMSMLLVGTNKVASENENPGVFRLYEVPSLISGSLSLNEEIEGLGEIVDIVYKENASN